MVDLTKVNKVSFKIDEVAKLRAAVGLNIGMTLGMAAAFVAIMLATMATWYKIFAGIGIFCAVLMQLGGVIRSIQQLKAYKNAMAEYAKLNLNKDNPTGYVG